MRNTRLSFILDHKLMDYRLPFFEQLAARGYDITVVHPGPLVENVSFLTQKLSSAIKIAPGLSYRRYKNDANPAIVIYMQNIRIINLWLITLNPFKNFKLIHWGIGVSSAKGLKLSSDVISKMRNFLSRFASAIILYSNYPLPLFSKSVHKKTFIANNTIFNPLMNNYSSAIKDSFLFIGSLNKRKGLDDLILSFSELMKDNKSQKIQLNIIGEGEEKKRLSDLSFKLGIAENVHFLGRIASPEEKSIYFKKAIASISPKQAGLSVLESFSYGVPFIAYEDAISGGEHLNIKNGENGYLLKSSDELAVKLRNLYEDSALSKDLGNNAYEYYKKKRQMKHMVDAFDSAFKYVISK